VLQIMTELVIFEKFQTVALNNDVANFFCTF